MVDAASGSLPQENYVIWLVAGLPRHSLSDRKTLELAETVPRGGGSLLLLVDQLVTVLCSTVVARTRVPGRRWFKFNGVQRLGPKPPHRVVLV